MHDAGSQAVSGVLQKLQTQMWKASRKGVSTFTQHCQGALEQVTKPLNSQNVCSERLNQSETVVSPHRD